MYKPVFIVICGMPQAFSIDLQPATIVYSGVKRKKNYIVDVNFSQIVAFKEKIIKFINVVTAHIEGLR
jgi:hypothetical protein